MQGLGLKYFKSAYEESIQLHMTIGSKKNLLTVNPNLSHIITFDILNTNSKIKFTKHLCTKHAFIELFSYIIYAVHAV